MTYLIIALLTIHVLAGVFWVGATAAMANLAGPEAARLFPAQMGSATLTVLTGLALWGLVIGGGFGAHAMILTIGIITAIIAAGVQGSMVGRGRRALASASAEGQAEIVARMATGNRIAAGLLMITVASMIIARFY